MKWRKRIHEERALNSSCDVGLFVLLLEREEGKGDRDLYVK
jgi:hypothetical protein